MDGRRRRLRASSLSVAFLTACSLLTPPAASAHTAPVVASGPTISGVAQQSQSLTASATWTGDPDPTPEWVWQRCVTPTTACTAILGATSSTYTAGLLDVGLYLRVR